MKSQKPLLRTPFFAIALAAAVAIAGSAEAGLVTNGLVTNGLVTNGLVTNGIETGTSLYGRVVCIELPQALTSRNECAVSRATNGE